MIEPNALPRRVATCQPGAAPARPTAACAPLAGRGSGDDPCCHDPSIPNRLRRIAPARAAACLVLALAFAFAPSPASWSPTVHAQESGTSETEAAEAGDNDANEGDDDAPGLRGSLVEDRAARRLLNAGDARLAADEPDTALEIWQSVIERYPRSRHRFEAHLRIGNHLLEQHSAIDEARGHFETAADPDNPDDAMRAEATLNLAICFHENRNYGKSFQILRDLIDEFPAAEQVNDAHYYIGLGHFQLGHYSRAIAALEKVGTAFSEDDERFSRVEAGRRLYVRVEDRDLSILEPGETIPVEVASESGDREVIECLPLGRSTSLALGSIMTSLGAPQPGNGTLEVRGGDRITVTYLDHHTADGSFDRPRTDRVDVVGTADVQIMDGSYTETLDGVVIGKLAHLQVIDSDRSRTPGADTLRAEVSVWRAKTDEEMERELGELLEAQAQLLTDEEAAAAVAAAAAAAEAAEAAAEGEDGEAVLAEEVDPMNLIDPFHQLAAVEVTFTEAPPSEVAMEEDDDALADAEANGRTAADGAGQPVFTGVFRAAIPVLGPLDTVETVLAGEAREAADAEDDESDNGRPAAAPPLPAAVDADGALRVRQGDLIRVRYLDEINLAGEPATREAEARAIVGDLGDVRVARSDISDRELNLRTRLRTADALTRIGNHYTDFGLASQAGLKYREALDVGIEIEQEARQIGGSLLEETYVQLWRIYFAMEQYERAFTVSQRLLEEFPQSSYVDEAMLQQAHVSRERGEFARAIEIFTTVSRLRRSPLRGEAQFGIAQTYEQMASARSGTEAANLFERAFTEYQKVYEQFPDSGRVGEAVAKMANFYYQKQDYHRAIDVFERVFDDHPDAAFLDVILFNYGRCLFRLDRTAEARVKFDQLISEHPESPLAGEAKQISEALARAGR